MATAPRFPDAGWSRSDAGPGEGPDAGAGAGAGAAAVRQARLQAVRSFVRRSYGPAGTLRLHRAALGTDLLRAPLNVILAPVFLLVRLAALLTAALRLRRTAGWLSRRRVLLKTGLSRRLRGQVIAFLAELEAAGLGPRAAPDRVAAAVDDYIGVRGAVSEMATTLIALLAGYLMFHTATLGVLSLTEPVAEMRARSAAIEGFPLGQGLGSLYYWAFPATLSPLQLALTGVVLAVLSSVLTTFVGLIADPLQVATGTHRRRLMRLIDRLEAGAGGGGLAREHFAARLADLSDVALSLWRMLRG